MIVAAIVSSAPTDPRSDIQAANQRFIVALKSGDFAAIASDYEDGGEYISVRADIVGRKNLEAYFAARGSAKFESGSCSSSHLSVSGDTAIEQGGCSLVFIVDGQRRTSAGHYVTVWKFHADVRRWLIHTNVVPD